MSLRGSLLRFKVQEVHKTHFGDSKTKNTTSKAKRYYSKFLGLGVWRQGLRYFIHIYMYIIYIYVCQCTWINVPGIPFERTWWPMLVKAMFLKVCKKIWLWFGERTLHRHHPASLKPLCIRSDICLRRHHSRHSWTSNRRHKSKQLTSA